MNVKSKQVNQLIQKRYHLSESAEEKRQLGEWAPLVVGAGIGARELGKKYVIPIVTTAAYSLWDYLTGPSDPPPTEKKKSSVPTVIHTVAKDKYKNQSKGDTIDSLDNVYGIPKDRFVRPNYTPAESTYVHNPSLQYLRQPVVQYRLPADTTDYDIETNAAEKYKNQSKEDTIDSLDNVYGISPRKENYNLKGTMLSEVVNPAKKLKKELDNSLKGVRKNNFSISRAFNKTDRNKAKKVMSMYKKYIIEYQIRMHKLLREMK